jgi:predicted nucleotidyltransferase component of viral defense system
MDSSPAKASRLSELQRLVLDAFFAREASFYLTGGAALAGYHLGHRDTTDLDLFTLDERAFERARHVLRDVATALTAKLEIVQDAPGFVRGVITRNDEALVVDLVREHSFQIHADKPRVGGIAVDPVDEILANKLTAIVGRAEERDLVDVFALERAGLRVEDALAAALRKDGGCTPATLAWLLSEITIPEGATLPGNVAAEDLRAWLSELIIRLRRAALPHDL